MKNDLLLINRLKGVGILDHDTALKDCTVGLTARASGVENDARMRDEAYAEAGFLLKTEDEGGCYARLKLGLIEIHNSLEIVSQIILNLPDGEIKAKMPDYSEMKQGETVAFVEQGGGELALYLKLNAGGEIGKVSMRSASAANMRTAMNLLVGADFRDISVILATMGICMPCFER
jgi:Ni,Fe-hydrogenase III large subunit